MPLQSSPRFAKKYKRLISSAVTGAWGWSTSRRIIVFQSDDWFSLRTANQAALKALENLCLNIDKCHYTKYDSLESAEDLADIFEVLASVTDKFGSVPVLTANCLVANPDFSRIKDAGFQEYFGQSSLETLRRIPGSENNMNMWVEAMQKGLVQPQCHGREHLNIDRWLQLLQVGDSVFKKAFQHGMCAVSSHLFSPKIKTVLAAFDGSAQDVRERNALLVSEALEGFGQIFGFPSKSFIAPNYVWDNDVESVAAANGVDYIQSARVQWFPSDEKRSHRRRFQGQKNTLGQRYIVRNVNFEPSSNLGLDWVDQALSEINLAFKLRKPAVISTHRVNFIGKLEPANRDRGLRQLRDLLQRMLKKWPDIEFLGTVELGELMQGKTTRK